MTQPLPKKFTIHRKKKQMPTTWLMRGCWGGNLPQCSWIMLSVSYGAHINIVCITHHNHNW